ncbi:UDP-N-acetylenolpyruvoylglucosamine reductase [Longibacter salinarum]|uniref:UDP-N-acetylenolpyruvoylglucosamine reductase n=1 Tax=Longibacter salinarum TaxID=1850348 RepID=A0A2A8CYC1_9BACT|nr:UDP-N-acetylmuramate dehydrogenase [Longibacter salinarum]PEN13378.1 UDP-N-acetylenolpyruvoylglucosamine reductase [Longibacter salinarum]
MSTPPIPAPALDALRDLFGADRVKQNVPLAPFTTFQLGGPADVYVEAQTDDELAQAIRIAREHDVHFFLLGMGANVLVGDQGFRGLVIRNAATHTEIDADAGTLWAESGAIMYPTVINQAINAGLSGLEHYAGIPSTVGGALWQNLHFLSPAPARERTMFIEEVLQEADILTESNERRTVGVDYFEFGYDDSILHHRDDVVLSATFQLDAGDPERMREIVEQNLEWRSLRHPPLDTEPSVGSIFKKIEGIGAGRLIDECGLKGAKIGGARVTHRHANIFVNDGGATAADLIGLIQYVQRVVEEKTGYRLETEIGFIGQFDEPSEETPTFVPKDPDLVTAADLAKKRQAQANS